MTFPYAAQPGPRPGPPPGGFRPVQPAAPHGQPGAGPHGQDEQQPGGAGHVRPGNGQDTGHPAVDAVLRSLANAARLAPGEQIAEYEAAHQVLQETLASIDR
ncbi:hypothetical protein ACTI_01050 [Actinoplanes sp. OR16]|nr:hypothetical protein ACTI_01050 [Actinoplanes sp. OR16]